MQCQTSLDASPARGQSPGSEGGYSATPGDVVSNSVVSTSWYVGPRVEVGGRVGVGVIVESIFGVGV